MNPERFVFWLCIQCTFTLGKGEMAKRRKGILLVWWGLLQVIQITYWWIRNFSAPINPNCTLCGGGVSSNALNSFFLQDTLPKLKNLAANNRRIQGSLLLNESTYGCYCESMVYLRRTSFLCTGIQLRFEFFVVFGLLSMWGHFPHFTCY